MWTATALKRKLKMKESSRMKRLNKKKIWTNTSYRLFHWPGGWVSDGNKEVRTTAQENTISFTLIWWHVSKDYSIIIWCCAFTENFLTFIPVVRMVSGLSRHLYVIKTKFRNEQVKERALQQVLAHNTAAIGVDEQWCRWIQGISPGTWWNA